ncbi:MAG: hypothetical protein ACRDRA_02950, partial [Pseudonocardiaceae bacterium]
PTSPSAAPAAILPKSRIAAPTEPPPGPPKPIYEATPIKITPLSCDVNNPSVDFDEPAFHDDYADGAAYKTDDLWYESCVGSIRQRAQAFIGTGPATQPTPLACASAAKTQPIGKLDVRHIKVGDALCIVTNNRQIAWAKVVRFGEPFHETLTDGRIPSIELVVTLWPAL